MQNPLATYNLDLSQECEFSLIFKNNVMHYLKSQEYNNQ